jgi:phosphoribosylformylglycinamidine synthase
MAARCGLDLDLDADPDLVGLPVEVVLFSESLGRFLVTTAPEDAGEFERRLEGYRCRRAGFVTADGRLKVTLGGATRVDLAVDDLVAAFKETLADD